VIKAYKEIAEDDCDLAEPFASSMSESLRAFGYDLPSAIADLVDNSIFAEARSIWIDFHWDGENSSICVTDDGRGMTEKEMLDAMRPGSRNPLEVRDPKDLGRYGLGLKTASFSQCQKIDGSFQTRWKVNR
jgi:signal transduction histidine kinase